MNEEYYRPGVLVLVLVGRQSGTEGGICGESQKESGKGASEEKSARSQKGDKQL